MVATRKKKPSLVVQQYRQYLQRLRCLTDNALLELHEDVFSSRESEEWKQKVPAWAYREDLERRLALLCTMKACKLPKDHPSHRSLVAKATEVLRQRIRVVPGGTFMPLEKRDFDQHLDGEPVLASRRKSAEPGKNRFYLRDLILENPGMNYATFQARYGRVMPKVTRGSFDTARYQLTSAGHRLPNLARMRPHVD